MASRAPKPPADLPVVHFGDAAGWDAWIEAHHDSPGAWLKIAKKDGGAASVSYADALDVALCHGWIDGLKHAFDASFFLQRFTPRRPGGLWSKVNVGKAKALMAAGRMREGGLREIEAAKADGRWAAAYDNARAATPPDELLAALAGNPAAEAFFASLDRANRYAVCWRVQTARTPGTRKARIDRLVAMLARGEKIHG
ncbi:MAG: YdeI/OmpD-associated family protein [Lysobacteraceae bacterium]